ncbi:aminoglycoside 6-adenylyltransferase [uncultured Finegoldia sp.]|uniref:aminoglycoside 6-adenylyltransferase n=1 Tax=uncultured Finegoldia sp. TaxID=328009 RepID=UPI00260DF46B|nr:aminoglycoside 6-adenylyltransferase [uncultured Finegoldia sp.]
MSSNIKNVVLDFSKKDDDIRSLVETGRRLNPSIERDENSDYHFVLGVSDLEKYKDSHIIENMFGDVLMLEKSDKLTYTNKINPHNVSYTIILDDITKIRIFFIKENSMQSYINEDSQADILLDKDQVLVGNSTKSDVCFRQMKPTRSEFESLVNQMFINSLNVAKGLYRKEEIYAIHMFNNVRDNVDKMTGYYIGTNYDFNVNIGYNYEYIKTYLQKEHYERYLETYPLPELENLWSTLFKSCELFRKQGLYVADILGYEYPKRIDRDIMQKIRDIWQRSYN